MCMYNPRNYDCNNQGIRESKGGGWVALPPVIGSVSLVSNKEGGTRGRGGEEVNPHSPETHILQSRNTSFGVSYPLLPYEIYA